MGCNNKYIWLAVCALLVAHTGRAQRLYIGGGYTWLHAPQWDKAIQTYNFSRPFAGQQPLLKDGVQIHGAYLLGAGKRGRQGVCLSYTYVGSSAGGYGLTNNLRLHLVKPGYLWHFGGRGWLQHMWVNVAASAVVGILNRNVEGASYTYPDAQTTAWAIGGSADVTCAYKVPIHLAGMQIHPYVQAGYAPYVYAPNAEPLLNQTKQLTSKNHTSIFTVSFGLMLTRGQ
jgi:hypothetical protein